MLAKKINSEKMIGVCVLSKNSFYSQWKNIISTVDFV